MRKRGCLAFLILWLILFIPNLHTYAASYTVSDITAKGVVIIDAPIYAEPDENVAISLALPIGVSLDVTGITSNGWYQLNISGITCYTPVGFLKVDNIVSNNTQQTVTNDTPVKETAKETVKENVKETKQQAPTYSSTKLTEEAQYTIKAEREIHNCINDAIRKHAGVVTITTPIRGLEESIYNYLRNFLHSEDGKCYYQGNVFGYKMYVSGYMQGSAYQGNIKINFTYGNSLSEEIYVEDTVASLVPQMLEAGTKYYQIKAVHDYICNTVNYDWNYTKTSTGYLYNSAYDCLVNKKAVCSGYALLFQKFMEQMGIPSYYVATSYHAWNYVNIDGTWYQIDCTWDGQDSTTVYDYFLTGKDADHPYEGTIVLAGARYKN